MNKMNKRNIISLFAIAFFVFGMAAAASAGVVKLEAKVPADKVLKAYKFVLTYGADVEVLDVEAAGSTVAVNNDTENKKIVANGFDVAGVKGPATVQIMKITVKGSGKDAKFGVTVEDFGNGDDKFESAADPGFVVEE
jgi:hypothetical protein